MTEVREKKSYWTTEHGQKGATSEGMKPKCVLRSVFSPCMQAPPVNLGNV